MANAKRDLALVMLGAAVSVAVLSATRFVAPSESDRGSSTSSTEEATSTGPAEPRAPCSAAEAGSALEAEVRAGRGQRELEQVRSELQGLSVQRNELEESLRAVEKELQKQEEPVAYEYAPTREQWKELAAEGRIKYRVPCQMSAREGWTIGAPILNSLGLSLEDREPIMEAFWRSNARVWSTVQPLCAELVPEDGVVELLGFEGCSVLIEHAAQTQDRMAMFEAQRAVAEVRAGMREATGEASPLQQLYLALTGEGERFQADLAQSFGPEDAERIWHGFPCAKYAR